jgi:hypothetical protein
MIWTTKLLNDYNFNHKVFMRDFKISMLNDDNDDDKYNFIDPFFNDNIFLRKSGVLFDLTSEEKVDIEKFHSDSGYISKYIGIELRDYQEEILNNFKKSYTIFVTGRQIGISTLSIINLIHYAFFNSGKRVFVRLINGSQLKHFMDSFFSIYRELPYHLKLGIKKWESDYILFENETSIMLSTSDLGIPGGYIDYFISPDLDYLTPDSNNFLSRIFQGISPRNPKILIYSSLGSKGGPVTDEVLREETIFEKFFYPQENSEIINIIGIESYMTEYLCIPYGSNQYRRELKLNGLLGV